MSLIETVSEIPEDIIEELISFLFNHGCIQPLSSNKRTITHIPIVITPTSIPKAFYDKIMFYQLAFNKLYSNLSEDYNYIKETLSPLIKADSHIDRHLKLLDKLNEHKYKAPISITVIRNDYTIEKNNTFIYQTNYKTLNISFAIYSDIMEMFHIYFSKKYPHLYKSYIDNNNIILPLNNPAYHIKYIPSTYDTIINTVKQYYPSDNVIIFVISKDHLKRKINQCEIQFIEKYINETHNINTKCMTIQDIESNCVFNEENYTYTYQLKPISLFYYFIEFDSNEFSSEKEWKIYEQIELSTSIKIPNLQSYLITHPLFQYFITKHEVASKYIKSEMLLNDLNRFYKVKMLFKEYDVQKQKELVDIVTSNLNKYIIKSQMKGINSICTDENIITVIPSSTCEISDELANTVVEDKISLNENKGILLVNGKASQVLIGSEYSVYGLIIKEGEKCLENKVVGFSVRSDEKKKIEDNILEDNEYAIDFPCLVNIEMNNNNNSDSTAQQNESSK